MSPFRSRVVLALAAVGTLAGAVPVRAIVNSGALPINGVGLGQVSAASIELAVNAAGDTVVVFEDPDYYLQSQDDSHYYRTLLFRRLSSSGTWLGEGRIDPDSRIDTNAATAALGGATWVAWMRHTGNGFDVTLRRIGGGTPFFGPLVPIVPDVSIEGELALAAAGDGLVVAWSDLARVVHARCAGPDGVPDGLVIDVDAGPGIQPDVAGLPGGGFVVAWRDLDSNAVRVRVYGANGLPLLLDDTIVAHDLVFGRVAVSDDGMGAVAGIRAGMPPSVVVQRFDPTTGLAIGPEMVSSATFDVSTPEVAFDESGNVYVAWGQLASPPTAGIVARAFDVAGTPLSPITSILPIGVSERVKVARRPNGTFANAALSTTGYVLGTVTTLCDPGTAVCGDGVLVSTCERCDDGAGNSDVTPDACRTTCRLPRCGDGVVDSGEDCDDGNTERCDGCSDACAAETGLVCGDGEIGPAACGEQCDDGGTAAGDGCSPACVIERIPGGGGVPSDCLIEWSVANPSNDPLFDTNGRVRAVQTCVDGDATCDVDATPGTCTFRMRVCSNNSDLEGCAPPGRLARWGLDKPSARQAAKKPELAAIRNALAGVPGVIVGPENPDHCTDPIDVPIALRSTPTGFRVGKVTLRATGATYGDVRDTDKIRLACLPAVP